MSLVSKFQPYKNWGWTTGSEGFLGVLCSHIYSKRSILPRHGIR